MFGTCPLATGSSVGSATDPAGGGACTVTADVPLLPSLVAGVGARPPSAPSGTGPRAGTRLVRGGPDAPPPPPPPTRRPLGALWGPLSRLGPRGGHVAR